MFAGLLNALAEAGACVDGFRDSPQALAAARGWDVARVAAFCGLPADEVAGSVASSSPPRGQSPSTPWESINPPAAATECNAIINVHLASGKYGRRGCGPFSLTGRTQRHGRPRSRRAGDDAGGAHGFCARQSAAAGPLLGDGTAGADPGLTAVELFAAIGRGEVKAVWIMGTDPVVSLPDSHAVSQALAACPLVIVSDVAAQTDTGRFAHIRFPALAWGEKNGTVTNSERRISVSAAFCRRRGRRKRTGGSSPESAKALGYREAFAWQHPHDVFREHAALSGFENDGQRAIDIGALAESQP